MIDVSCKNTFASGNGTGTDDERIYPVSLKIMVEQGYLDKLMDFRSWNLETEQQFMHIREKMQEYCRKYAE